MKLGWSVTLTIEDYETLVRTGKWTFGKEGAVYMQKKLADDQKFYGVVGFKFGVDDLPPRELFVKWIETIYDNDPEEYDRLSKQIADIVMGKKILEKEK